MIALYKGQSWISRLIQWRTWSDYSHAAWVCDDGSVIEAWVDGFMSGSVRRVENPWARHTPGTDVEFYDVALTPEQHWAAQEFLMRQVGKPYDFRGIWGFMTRKPEQEQGAWFCSELVFTALQAAGVPLLARIEAFKVSPGLLALSPLLRPAPNPYVHNAIAVVAGGAIA